MYLISAKNAIFGQNAKLCPSISDLYLIDRATLGMFGWEAIFWYTDRGLFVKKYRKTVFLHTGLVMITLELTNTLTKKKEVFAPLEGNTVKVYGCGVTPYDYSHIGHGRTYVSIDLLVRFLRYCGYDVTYVRNITDIDDKLLKKGEEAGDVMLYKQIAEKFTKSYQKEMAALNCLVPDAEPKVTESIDAIIRFIEQLVIAGKAYVVDGDVYFDVSSYKSYGRLSGRNIDELQAGARVKVDERKKNPADFALWKGAPLREGTALRESDDKKLFWDAPWGHGRPGWHIECSVMAKEFLGETIDIHCGGADLIFPHHENERAQSESLHQKTFARFWMHNAFLNIDKEKMSKSLGNILSLKEIFEKHDPMVLRFYFLQHQYKTPIEFNFEMLHSAGCAYKRLVQIFNPIQAKKSDECALVKELCAALSDDLNTPKMLGILFENLSEIKTDQVCAASVKSFLQEVLGLTFAPLAEECVEITPHIKELLEKREKARAEKNWAVADKIRDELEALGYKVQDKKL